MMRKNVSIWRTFLSLCIGSALTLALCGNTWAAGQVTVNHQKTVRMKTTFEGTATSYTRRGKDPFSVGYYVKNGEIIAKHSLLANKNAKASRLNLDLDAVGQAFDAVIATGKGTNLTLTGSISASDNGNGKEASDFSGLGAMVVASNYAKVQLDDMTIHTKGFLRSAFISDNHAQILVKNSTITTLGANPLTQAYKGYVNSANQNIMLSPPWVLGIQGGVRAANMLGDKSTLTVIDTSVTSGAWAVLSTDAGNNVKMNVVDSNLQILPESKGGMSSGNFSYSSKYGSGYGTYLIGNAVQDFYGVTFRGMTFASIFTGGEAFYRSSSGKIRLKNANGKTIETMRGKGRPTVINSVFGFMTHGGAKIHVLDGTVVNTEEATFLYKDGDTTFQVDGAKLNPASGIILQMMDNDDTTVGGSMNGFNTTFKEAAGWPSENGNVTTGKSAAGAKGGPGGGMPGGPGKNMAAGGRSGGPGGQGGPGAGMPGGNMAAGGPGRKGGPGGPGGGGRGGASKAKLVLTNGNYRGDVFNGTGYYKQSGKALTVIIGKEAALSGAISLTETRHIDENGKQNTHFTINQYYYLGHVANRNYRNGHSKITVTLKNGGVWKVTKESLISKLVVDRGTVEGANGAKVVMTVDGKQTPIESDKTYAGKIVLSPAI